MHCPICGKTFDGTECPNCVTRLPASGQEERTSQHRVVDAEILHDSSAYGNSEQQAQSTGFSSQQWHDGSSQGFTWTAWQSVGQKSSGHTGFSSMSGQFAGMSFWITLALVVICGMQYGILAAIGFLFFYTIGAALGMFFTVSRLMHGICINPWAIRLCNWTICWLLTSWLAQ